MGKMNCLFLSVRFFTSILITVSLLSVSFSNIDINNDIKSDINNIYQATSVIEYYNFITDIPIKLVSKFIMMHVDTSSDSNKQNKKQNNNTNSKDIAFITNSIYNVKILKTVNSFDKTITNYSTYNVCSIVNYNYCCLFLFVFVIMLLSSRLLARGDTEDNIKFNNNMNEIRLV